MPAISMRWLRAGGRSWFPQTTFLEFQMRPKNAWLKLHKPQLLEQFKLSDFSRGMRHERFGLMAFSSPL
jgi:hypothetical protein